jgi:hypothetical protein
MTLFTTILDYRGGTYIQQVTAAGPHQAIRKWTKALDVDAIPGVGKRGGRELARSAVDEDFTPTPITGLAGVWCATTLLREFLALVTLVETVSKANTPPNKRKQRTRAAPATRRHR